ncbi:MAG: hypothetical protein HC896_13670 [Bacteroidales bacterium]|nr:hypothetical protein [Bacteroidales bacterium]
MGIPSLFKTPRHRQFNYQPVYYNPVKEELEQRTKKAKGEAGSVKQGIQRGQMRGYFHHVASQKKQSNIRLVVILLALFLLAYYLLFNGLTS